MYEYLNGVVTFVSPAYLVLEVNQVGFLIQVANPFIYQEGDRAKIYVHQVVREDAQLLFGFFDLAEKELFLRLLSVSGIGPKSALAILAGRDHQGLKDAVEREDVKYLMKFPGVGKKTAQQMILDLKGKLAVEINDAVAVLPEKKPLKEAMSALKALGYKDSEIAQVEKNFQGQDLATEQYISAGLKFLMKK
ncbi:Holliday junction branch migration protein RuvA [Enterococcus timonensis]|uniref:Holliday junction branch migration protein RuvA n=1 Tax=Enterococcus timonensis TaxID=1852364 RepID=UPI0008DAB46E|nr:Holliday junction branch migration protein RuvA [Enterococcus timonensis]